MSEQDDEKVLSSEEPRLLAFVIMMPSLRAKLMSGYYGKGSASSTI